jgi:hypothetical protein
VFKRLLTLVKEWLDNYEHEADFLIRMQQEQQKNGTT